MPPDAAVRCRGGSLMHMIPISLHLGIIVNRKASYYFNHKMRFQCDRKLAVLTLCRQGKYLLHRRKVFDVKMCTYFKYLLYRKMQIITESREPAGAAIPIG